jgi:transposase
MIRLDLNDNEKMDLQLEARRAVGRVSERIHFVLLAAQGHSAPEIGQLMGYDAASVRRWLKAYHDGGLVALNDAPRSGRPRVAAHLDDVVEAQVSQPPPVFGYLPAIWTVAMLVTHIAQFGIHASVSTVRRTLKRLRFSWHRPKWAPARRRDPRREEKEAHLQRIWPDPTGHLIAVDECDLHLLAPVRAMWQRIRTQVHLTTPGQNAKRPIFGGLDVRTGQWFSRLADHKRTTDFIAFLTDLLAAYPVGMIYVILDNSSIHSSAALLKWVAAQGRIDLVYLPTYCGHRYNPVEKVWWRFKGFIAANRCVRSLAELDAVASRWFTQQTPAAMLTLTARYTARLEQLATPQKVLTTSGE